MKSNLIKLCDCCDSNRAHEDNLIFEQPPEILMFIINRFDANLANSKNQNSILIDRKLIVSTVCYDLLGSIHHHGSTITSGHYTSIIWYPEFAFLCNDSHITPLRDFPSSDSAYIVLYSRRWWPNGLWLLENYVFEVLQSRRCLVPRGYHFKVVVKPKLLSSCLTNSKLFGNIFDIPIAVFALSMFFIIEFDSQHSNWLPRNDDRPMAALAL